MRIEWSWYECYEVDFDGVCDEKNQEEFYVSGRISSGQDMRSRSLDWLPVCYGVLTVP